jgi:hypothetical protein
MGSLLYFVLAHSISKTCVLFIWDMCSCVLRSTNEDDDFYFFFKKKDKY